MSTRTLLTYLTRKSSGHRANRWSDVSVRARQMSIASRQTEDANKDNKSFTTVVVEGNIGSGKTTFLQHFAAKSQSSDTRVQIFAEPIEKWRDVRGVNMFELLALDVKRWCFPFQSYVQLSMLEVHNTPTDAHIKLMERSIYSARYCFVENLYRSGCLQRQEYVVLDEWFRHIVHNENIGVDLIIYLRTKPEVVYDRIRLRARSEERNVSLDYLQRLHELHEQWLVSGQQFASPAPVITIDANQNLEDVKHLFEVHSQNILNGDLTNGVNAFG